MWQGDKGENVYDFVEHWLERYLDQCLKANDMQTADVIDLTLQRYVEKKLDVVFEEGEPVVYNVHTNFTTGSFSP